MNRMIYLILIALLTVSCNHSPSGPDIVYCGYELSTEEYIQLREKTQLQESPYDADTLGHIYAELNDSIRAAMPDSIEFEVFLSLLNSDEVAIDVYVPYNQEYFKIIGCAIMTSRFASDMPDQRYMCLYTYTNPDGSGELPLEVAIKRRKGGLKEFAQTGTTLHFRNLSLSVLM